MANKLSKTVSVDMPNVRHDGKSEGWTVLALALERDGTTIKVSIGGSTGCEVYVRVTDLIEAVRLFEAAVGSAR